MTACFVFRSDRMEGAYLYLPIGQKFEDLPEALRSAFGEPAPVMKLDVEINTKLAQADASAVLDAFEEQGYFLQLPPKVSVEELLTSRFG